MTVNHDRRIAASASASASASAAGAGACARQALRWLLAALPLWAGLACAAGGHHAVDDAALLDPGQCQIDVWADRERDGARTLHHGGPACRAGAVEIGVSLDRTRLQGQGAATAVGAQVKWAHPLDEHWAVGVALSAAAPHRQLRQADRTWVVPLTWQAAADWRVHANVGRDFKHAQPDASRGGVALEWAASDRWSFVAERFREGGADFWRGGARWQWTPSATLDLSRAQGAQGSAPAWWTLGLTWAFQR